jgi:hypothetical protein
MIFFLRVDFSRVAMSQWGTYGAAPAIPWFVPLPNAPSGVAWHATGKRPSYDGRDSKGGKGKGNMKGQRGGNKGSIGKGGGECNDFKLGRCSRGASCRFSHGGCESETPPSEGGRFTYYKFSFIEDPWARLLGPVASTKQTCSTQSEQSLGGAHFAAKAAVQPTKTPEPEAGPQCAPEESIGSPPNESSE